MTPPISVPPSPRVQSFAAAVGTDIADLYLSVIGPDERPRMLAHLVRLSDLDRRMRFMKAVSDRELEAFVETADFSRATRMGWLDVAGELVALCEGFFLETVQVNPCTSASS